MRNASYHINLGVVEEQIYDVYAAVTRGDVQRCGAVIVGQVWRTSSIVQEGRDHLQMAVPVTRTKNGVNTYKSAEV